MKNLLILFCGCLFFIVGAVGAVGTYEVRVNVVTSDRASVGAYVGYQMQCAPENSLSHAAFLLFGPDTVVYRNKSGVKGSCVIKKGKQQKGKHQPITIPAVSSGCFVYTIKCNCLKTEKKLCKEIKCQPDTKKSCTN